MYPLLASMHDAHSPNSPHQVVSIKSKYILLNDTGLGIEFKQRNTPDPGDARYVSYGDGRRFAGPLQPTERCVVFAGWAVWRGGGAACVAWPGPQAGLRGRLRVSCFTPHAWAPSCRSRLAINQAPPCSLDRTPCSCALHWDNVHEARELQIRPIGPGWEWSGAFSIPEREEYVGLRIRNRCGRGKACATPGVLGCAPLGVPPGDCKADRTVALMRTLCQLHRPSRTATA